MPVAPPVTLADYLANALYESLAANAETRALEAEAKAAEFRAKAGDYTAQAEAKQAEAATLTQQAASQRQQAEALSAQALQRREEAQVQRQLAAEADAQAVEYRRLADEAATPTETTRLFAYDAQGMLIGEYHANGAPIREYVYLEGQPLAQLSQDPQSQAEAVYYLHTDHLGTVVKATGANRSLVWDAVRRPFGERTVSTGQIEMLLGFAGQYFDEETGNFYNYFRDYDPTTGRYLQSDPIGLDGGLNVYTYAL